MLKKAFLGVLFPVFVSGLLIGGINFNVTKGVDYGGSGTSVGGYISENTTWTLQGSPYIVVEDVIVESDAFLIVEPSVFVKFTSGKSLVIDGGLVAHGNDTHKITFTSNSTAPAPEDYVGVQVRSSAEYASFDHCIVEYAKTAIYFGECEVEYALGTVVNSIIRSCSTGISAWTTSPCRIIIENTTICRNYFKGLDLHENTTLSIRNSTICGNGYHGICGGSVKVENCVVSQNNGWGILGGGSGSYVKNSIVSYNKFGIVGLDQVQYTLISGSRGPSPHELGVSPYAVKHCREISNCTIVHNEGFGACECNRILDSVIMDNTYGGVVPWSPSWWGDAEIFGCVISENSGIGVKVGWGSVIIEKCNITNNMGVGIRDEGGRNGSLDVNHCNLFGNVNYDFEKALDRDSDATNNWWGTTNETLIEEQIYDYYDDYNLGKIFYKPYLTEPESIPYPSCPSEPADFVPPFISNIQRTSVIPNYDEDVVVSATVTDNVEVDQAFLSYTRDSAWHNVSMNKFDDTFKGTISAQPYETLVSYKIYANDTNGNWAESDTFLYTVTDTIKPEIVSVNWTPAQPTWNDFVKVAVNVSEPVNASGVDRVLFSFKDCFGQWWNTTMKYDSTSGLWNVTTPKQPYNTTVQFYIIAYDNVGNCEIEDNEGEYYVYQVVPEFPSILILPLFMMATLLVVIVPQKKRRTKSSA